MGGLPSAVYTMYVPDLLIPAFPHLHTQSISVKGFNLKQ